MRCSSLNTGQLHKFIYSHPLLARVRAFEHSDLRLQALYPADQRTYFNLVIHLQISHCFTGFGYLRKPGN